MRTSLAGLAWTLTLGVCLGCSSSRIDDEPGTGDSSAGGEGGGPSTAEGLTLTVGPDARTFVSLATPSLVELEGDGKKSLAWDLALQGHGVLTNGGISGPGNSRAFGPLSAPTYLSDTAPEVPLLLEDRAGGAFIDWYDYGGATHQLFSRYHVYGLRDGERYYRLQILSYYGEQLGVTTPALYRIRYAEVLPEGLGEAHEVADIDATAGGGNDDSAPSACIELDTEEVTMLTPDEAVESDAWQLCFRRESVAVNGGLSGPRALEAVDLQAADSATEVEAEIQERTAESERARFDAADFEALTLPELDYQPDGVVTAFGSRWLEPGSDPLAVSNAVWLVLGSDGVSKYLLRLRDLVGDPGVGDATLTLQAKAVR
jgi:hypothetical protein